ncbi:MAG TPA: 50S ribosomal protein L10 [Candidatus Caldiarchaeum subterraneum]|uniref:Large ribosomal subunit protein uL10 n=1 Tax=Caldiarchaeum subterraneum TaxID=311458 RepID=A0A833E9F8_CALS0|nr:50S ribosomal protein L10 [Aigarchaeota archaeon]HIQ29114.1 50S ribosomal protein L10 [Candidatus Caldarchaeum subterraneum]
MSQQTVLRPSLLRKRRVVEELARLIKEYPAIAVFDLTGTRANIIHEMRRKLRDMGVVKVAKKTLFMKAADLAGRPDVKKLVEDLAKPAGFIFTTLNTFKLSLIIEQNKIPMFAKAGETADFDVWIPETNTGLPPGPILTDFGKLKIPTRIEGGQIWVAKDTLVAKKGDVIDHLLASILVRLNIKSVMRGLSLIAAYEDGVIIKAEDLKLDLGRFRQDLAEATQHAMNLAVEIGYVTPETIRPIITLAVRRSMNVALEAGYVSRDIAPQIIARAHAIAAAVAARIGQAG